MVARWLSHRSHVAKYSFDAAYSNSRKLDYEVLMATDALKFYLPEILEDNPRLKKSFEMAPDNPLKQKIPAIYIGLAKYMRWAVYTLQVIALFMAIQAVASPARAGPAILPTAQPDFQDPLSRIRAPAARFPDTNAGNSQDDPTGASDPGFTIIGDQGSDGLQEPESDDLTQAVRDELLGRARDQTVPGDNGGAESTAAGTSGSAAEIVRALVNTVPGQSGGAAGGGRQNGNGGLIASVIDSTVTDLVVTLLNPEQATDGMVTFSIAGFGDFALLHLQENDSLFIVDLDGGTAIKVSEGGQTGVQNTEIRRNAGGETQRQGSGKSNALQRVISFLEDNVLPFIQSPITLAAVGLFSIIWIIWRISAQG